MFNSLQSSPSICCISFKKHFLTSKVKAGAPVCGSLVCFAIALSCFGLAPLSFSWLQTAFPLMGRPPGLHLRAAVLGPVPGTQEALDSWQGCHQLFQSEQISASDLACLISFLHSESTYSSCSSEPVTFMIYHCPSMKPQQHLALIPDDSTTSSLMTTHSYI